ncbi:MAG: ankyrin repeat domain-containing protein [Ruminiclostridium sp.]
MRIKKAFLILLFLCMCITAAGCSDKEVNEISKLLRMKTGITVNSILNENAVDQYQTAIKNGNIEWMKEIVEENPGLDVNYVDEMTAMYCAWWESYGMDYDKAKMVEALLEVGVDPNTGDPLQMSTYNKKYYYTKALLKSDKTKLDTTDVLGITPLAMAMENHQGGSCIDCHEQVMLMLEAGAEPYAELFHDENADSELGTHFPYVEDNPVSGKLLMNMLLESGQPSGLKPALEYAFSGQMDKCLEELKSHDIESEYNKYERYVIYRYFTYFGTPEQFEESRKLLNCSLANGTIALPSETGNYELSKYLLETYPDVFVISGPDADSFSLRGFTYAIYWGYADICKLFCDKNVSVKRTAWGYNEMELAIASEDLETVKVIYNYIKERDEFTEQDLGCSYKWQGMKDREESKKILDFFFDEGYDLSGVEFGYMDKDIAEYLYEKGRPLAPTDLTYAVLSEDPEFVKLVLDKGADPNQNNYIMNYPNIWNISETGKSRTYEEYINTVCGNFDIPIFFVAIEKTNSEIVKILLDYGADVNISEDGITPIQAALRGSKATAKVLIEAGANIDIIIDDRPTGISFNAINYNFALPEYFERHGRKDLSDLVKEYQK